MSSAENNEPEASERTADRNTSNKGMILPFQPLSMTFHNVNYFVDMPKVDTLCIVDPFICD